MNQSKFDIFSFDGEFSWLSNFYPVKVCLDDQIYPSVENAYQAAKTRFPEQRWKFQLCSAGLSKKFGRRVTVREDWDSIKLKVMGDLLRQKFEPSSMFSELLISTGERLIVEGNTWNDKFWGVCDGEGENHLGKIIMKIRRELQQ